MFFTLGLAIGFLSENSTAERIGWGICGATILPHLVIVMGFSADD